MKRDKLFRLSLAILFLWTSLALAAPAAMAASSTALPGSSLWEPYLQQSRIDLEKASSSPWETLKSFLPQSFGALVRQTAKPIVDLIEQGNQVVIAHGNGPQVGMINLGMSTAAGLYQSVVGFIMVLFANSVSYTHLTLPTILRV